MMKRFLAAASILFVCHHAPAQESQVTVEGSVREKETGSPIPSAIIRVGDGMSGTVCNSEGRFRIILVRGRTFLVASSIGFSQDSVYVDLLEDTRIDFVLLESAIVMPEIVVSGEDPAYEIVRRAIANKKRWIDRLHSYQFSAFTRQVLQRDTTIASITEAFTSGYWRQGDTLREVTSRKRQTENIESEFNFASVGRILNFQEDEVRFVGHTFVGPIADDTFDHYRYKLLRTRMSDSNELYEIELIPISEAMPRFRGTINIAGGSYALVGADVEPNEAFLLPFVRDKYVRYRQQFSQFEQAFWLPADIRIDARFTISIPGFDFPQIGFAQTSVITDYRINIPLADSIFTGPRLVTDSSAVNDTTVWQGADILPLTAEEKVAYETLDSTQTLDVQFRPGGIGMTLGGDDDGGFALLKLIDLQYNRIEGVHLGGKVTLDSLFSMMNLRGGFAYGFSDKMTKYFAGATVRPDDRWGIGFDYEEVLKTIPEQGYYETLFNSITSLVVRNDYRDYYLSSGWSAFVDYAPARTVRASLTYRHQEHTAASSHTDYGFIRGLQEFRLNPSADQGEYRSFQLALRLGPEPVPLDFLSANSIDLVVEASPAEFADNDFSFVRSEIIGTLGIKTFGERFLSSPGFRIRLAAGVSGGEVPRQRAFSLESSSSGVGPFGVMRGMRVKEFFGSEYVALNVEHNFRSLPFLALDIPFLYRNNIEFIVHGGVARSWDSKSSTPLSTTDGVYGEIGFGISRIFELVRADFTWRLSSPHLFHFTLSTANLF